MIITSLIPKNKFTKIYQKIWFSRLQNVIFYILSYLILHKM